MRCMKKESGPAICRTGGVLKGCLIGGMLFISACASYEKSNFSVGSIPGDYRTNHPIVVSQSEVVRDLIVPSNAKGMTFRQENILNELAIQYRQFGANTMRILMPSGSHNENAARRVVKDIVEHLSFVAKCSKMRLDGSSKTLSSIWLQKTSPRRKFRFHDTMLPTMVTQHLFVSHLMHSMQR